MKKKADKCFVIVVCIMMIVMMFIPTGFENPSTTDSVLYEKAVITDVNNNDLRSFSIITTGVQKLTLLVKSGKFAGDTISAENVLLGQKNIDKIFSPGDKVLVVLQQDETKSHCVSARAYDFYRQNLELLLFGCFALFLILFAKLTGLKALLSFVFTALTFWKLLIPAYLKGFSPLWCSLGIVFLTSTVIIILVGGLNRKGLVSLLGTMAGVFFTALLATSFGYFFKIPGTVKDFSEALLYSGFLNLDLSNIFISVIFISAAGALMDVSMDISAAQNEIITRIPDLSSKELIKSGFRIASPVIGTMTTTLLFAYTGSFMFAFMAFMSKGTPFVSIVNTGYIAAEILHTLVGSFGLVLVAPLTAIIGGLIYSHKKK